MRKPIRLKLTLAGSLISLFAVLVAAVLAAGKIAGGVGSQRGFAQVESWRDTDGNPINAHGGGVLFHQGVYYWYGESKSGRTYLPDCNKSWGGTRVDLTGVS